MEKEFQMHSILAAAAAPFTPPWDVQAYLDPGSGSYLIQLLIAGLVGALFIIKTQWGRIRSFFRNLTGREQRDD